jgi:hypothetical protein
VRHVGYLARHLAFVDTFHVVGTACSYKHWPLIAFPVDCQ